MSIKPGAEFLVLCFVAVLVVGTQQAMAQRCPPNSHPEVVAIPGNLRTAQCFCDPGFVPVNGLCVPVDRPDDPPPPNDPGRAPVAPQPLRR